MVVTKRHIIVLFWCGFLPCSSAVLQAAEIEDSVWQHGAHLDVAYGINENFPDNHQWRSKSTTPRTNLFAMNMGFAYLKREPNDKSRWGLEVAVQGGYNTERLAPQEHQIEGADVLRHVARANVSYLMPMGNGVNLTGGLIQAFTGYESFYAKNRFHYTRAYLSDYNPDFMFAVGGRYPMTSTFVAGLYLLNGFHYLAHANDLPSYGAEVDWKMTDHLTLHQDLYYGPDQTSIGIKFWRLFSESTIEWSTEDWTIALLYDFGTQLAIDEPSNPRQFWLASALFTQYELGGPWAIGVRPEVFWDRNGIATQARQLLIGMTSTLKYSRHIGHHEIKVWLEYRFDRSTGPEGGFYLNGRTMPDVRLASEQHVVWLGFLWAYDS